METVFRNQLLTKNQSLRDNVFPIRFLETAHMPLCPHLHTPLWRSAWLVKHRDNFTFFVTFT
jgi:hypothetical protein